MPRMAKKKSSKKAKSTRASKARSSGDSGGSGGKADTIVRTYRFQRPLYDEFEEFCARHLMNPKLVIEASILHFMEASAEDRAAISARHLEAVGRE